MGDISRHRDIYFNTRDVIPPALLSKCKLSRSELTYLELGNYLTDVSQFRDPVTYIFAKQRIWRDFVFPKVRDKALAARILGAMAGYVGVALGQTIKDLAPSVGSYAEGASALLAEAAVVAAALPTDAYATLGGADDWIDAMFGTPIERTIGDPKKRDARHYGLVGEFFRHFIEGITQWIFAADVREKAEGAWSSIDRISNSSITKVYDEFFTQYFPHEHTDQPPFVWDASERPKYPRWYGVSTRQRTLADKDIGVMNAVDRDYVQYLSEGLSDLEQEWRRLKPEDVDGRHKMLIRMGKLLHGVEDWYFHSNVVELIRLRAHKPPQKADESGEDFARRFVNEISKRHQEFVAADAKERLRLQRRVWRRLRFPVYGRGNRKNSGGIVSKKDSTLSLHFAYPAFPSQQDTAHTLLHALENIEGKVHGGRSRNFELWMLCVLEKAVREVGGPGSLLLVEKAHARGTTVPAVLKGQRSSASAAERDLSDLVIADVLREWVPLVLTLLQENERQRLLANVEPMTWPVRGGTEAGLKGPPDDTEMEQQLERHKRALKPVRHPDGVTESNYERAVRHLLDCGFINASGRQALVAAFRTDQKSQKLLADAPGAGGFLIQFAVDLQRQLDEGDQATAKLNEKSSSMFDPASDNGAFNEIIGSHSLISKDTLTSPPFFTDAKVLASVASSSVFHVMLEQVSKPSSDRRLPWRALLHHLIRFPTRTGGWERQAIEFFTKNNRIPKYADLPELAQVVEGALRSKEALQPWQKGTKDEELKNEYITLERKVSKYRYPTY